MVKGDKDILIALDEQVERELLRGINDGLPVEYRGVRIIDLDTFYHFVVGNVKSEYIDFERVLDDLIFENHDGHYELGSSRTVSGNAEDISFDETTDEGGNVTIEF